MDARHAPGGRGHLIGDEGSAYGVVCDALRLVARRWDGREPQFASNDPLSDRMVRLGATSPAEIVTRIYAPGFDRAGSPPLLPTCWPHVPRPPTSASGC